MSTLAQGQLPNTQTSILAALGGPLERVVAVKLGNRSAVNAETVQLFVQKGAGTPTLEQRFVLDANGTAISDPIVLGTGDAILGQATDAATVDYRIFDLPAGVPAAGKVMDASGQAKTKTVSAAGVGGAVNNLSATTDPLVSSDGTLGYAAGSVWLNLTGQRAWICVSAATGAAVWELCSPNPANFRNLIDGGDFTTNPFQRGTSQAADIANTLTYGPDRFWFKGGGAGSAINWSQVADATVAGFANSLKWQRKAANADVSALNAGQVVETADAVRMQGQQVTLSFWARAGANYSGGSLTVQLESGTGTNQSANNCLAGTWTGQAHVVNATQALTTTMTRYQFTGTVPAGCTQLGLLLAWTPTGTAGADDSIISNGYQLEVGAVASPFEHRDFEVELALCQRYYFRIAEANGLNLCTGAPTGTNTQGYSIFCPTPMRVAPTVTVTAGGWKVILDGAAPAAVAGFAAGTAHSVTVVSLVTTNTLSAAAHSILLQGSATTGLVEASSEF